ncbi:MAG: hypothetical protein ACPKQO_10325 [Nitrososphaeraceae archaeon]
MKNNNLILVLLLSTLSVLIIASTLYSIYAQEENVADREPDFLSIQRAQSGSISKINTTNYSLELKGVSDNTISFYDRPNRIVKTESTSNFIGNWTATNWSERISNFATSVPNIVLIVDEPEGQQEITIIELFNPVYDLDKESLKYDVTPDNATSIDLPSEFGKSTLIIDCPPGCPSLC